MVVVTTFSEVGDHPHNEDAFVVEHHPFDPSAVVCFVADGQGGRAGGGPAAELACRTAANAATRLTVEDLRSPDLWAALLREADGAVHRDPAAGFTTAVGAGVVGGQIVGASCGDSAALLVTETRVVELTRAQHKNPPVGSGGATPVPFTESPDAPWRLLLVTDGVWKYVGWPRLIEAARRERGAALLAALQRAARLPGSGRFPDDFTAVLLEQPC